MGNRRQRWGGWLVVVAAFAMVMTSPVGASEKDEKDPAKAAPAQDFDVSSLVDTVSMLEDALVITRPTGWNLRSQAGTNKTIFRATSDERAEIEIRVSSEVSERRWESYWRSFDSDLRKSGFQPHRGRTAQTHNGKEGLYFEYRFQREERGGFHLLVWHAFAEDHAWVFTAFFSSPRYDAYSEDFREMLDGLNWR